MEDLNESKQELIEDYVKEVESIYTTSGLSFPQRGAAISALNKHTKRVFLAKEIKTYMSDKDVTPTAAMQIFKGVMGRGVSNRYLIFAFGKPGRTASEKSEIFTEDLSSYIEHFKKSLKSFSEELKVHCRAAKLRVL